MITFPENSSIVQEFERILNIQNALHLLKISSGVSVDIMNDKETHSAFNVFFEALVFDKIARLPFFEVIRYIEPHRIFELIINRNIKVPCRLTYFQIYTLLKSFRFSDCKRIIELLPLTPQVFNSLLISIENNEFDKFSKTLDKCESLNWVDWLATLGYVCFGTLQSDHINTLSSNSVHRLANNWLSGLGFDEYFANINEKDSIDFINREQRLWSGLEIDPPKMLQRKRRFHHASEEVYRAMNEYHLFFNSSLDLWTDSCAESWSNYSKIVCNAQWTADAIFKEVFDRNSRILVSDKGYSANLLDYYANLKYIDTRDILPLQRYVSATSMVMVEIFALVEVLLPDEIKQSLQYILEANPYTLRAMELKSNYMINGTSAIERNESSLESNKDADYNDDPEYTKSENCVRRFIDDNFDFTEDKKKYFMDTYQRSLVEFILSIKNSKAFYSLVYLIYPIKKLPGKGAYNHIEKGKHLERGIHWKNEPNDSDGVCERLIYHIPYLELYRNVGKDTKSPAKCINKLVEEVSNGNRWIKSFIEDYWPNDPMTDFKEKLKDASK